MPIQRFEPFPGSPEGRGPRRVFGYFLHAAKSNVKRPWGHFGGWGHAAKSNIKTVLLLLFAKAKRTQKPFLFRLFAKRKAPLTVP